MVNELSLQRPCDSTSKGRAVAVDNLIYCTYGHTYSKGEDQPGKVANPTRGQLSRENLYFPVPVRA